MTFFLECPVLFFGVSEVPTYVRSSDAENIIITIIVLMSKVLRFSLEFLRLIDIMASSCVGGYL